MLPYDGPTCMADVCAEPFVPAAPLTAATAPEDVQEGALLAALDTSAPPGPKMPNPNPYAPTSVALEGAEQSALAYRAAHPNERAAVVLVTAGIPMGCDTNPNDIAQLAADAYQAAGVRTFAIGFLGDSSSTHVINAVAQAGGTEAAFMASDDDVAARFRSAVTDFQWGSN